MRKKAVVGAFITSWQTQEYTCPMVAEVLTKLRVASAEGKDRADALM